MNIFQAAAISVTCVLVAVQFKYHKEEYSSFISIILCILILFAILGKLAPVMECLKRIGTFISIRQEYINTLFKMVGVAYVSEFSAGLCKDAGYQNIAVHLESLGKIIILSYSMPILLELLKMIRGLWI